jgi:oxygen-independent coproporphyrinogen-3 oxidase
VEGRVSTLTEAKLTVIRKRGISRLSIGVQSFNPEVRRRAGRTDTPETIIETLHDLNAAGSPLLVIDLMYGLPGQSLKIFKKDLELAAGLALPAISAYMLKLMPRSPLFAKIQKGLEPPPPGAAVLSEYYQATTDTLAGYIQTSGNHWRLDERDRNVYNTLALGRRDILAWGAGAGGSVGGAAFTNTSDIEKYIQEIEAGRKPWAFFKAAPANHRILNEASRQIHSGVIDFDGWPEEGGLELARPLLEQWQRAGLLDMDGRRAALNQAGLFWRGNLEFALRGWLAMNLGDKP